MKFLFSSILGCALLVLPIACATLPVPTEESAAYAAQQWPGTTLENLQAGRRHYVATCASCHILHMPAEYTPEHWEIILEKMQPRARIDNATKGLILHYLMVASSEETRK